MQAVRREVEDVLPLNFGGHLRPFITLFTPFAVRMHFFGSSRKLGGSRTERTCKEPYALYAPLLGVGPFFALFLLREPHMVHTTAYGSHRNPALALLPVGIEALPAREIEKCIRICIRLFADFGRKRPSGEIDPPPPVFDSARRAGRLLPLETILWPL